MDRRVASIPSLLLLAATVSPIFAGEPGASGLVAVERFDGSRLAADSGFGWEEPWKTSARMPGRLVRQRVRLGEGTVDLTDGRAVEIRGTNRRNNPLRRPLAEPFSGDDLYVRFLLRYDAESIDTPAQDEGEFFVLWLDDVDGSDGATHNANVPNIGLHVGGGKPARNLFMVRIGSSNADFTKVEVAGDRTFLVVGRLSKSAGGAFAAYDTFSMWVDPAADDRDEPLARVTNGNASNLVRWIGFATGRKTEPDDRIWIDELALGRTWESVLGLPPREPSPAGPKGSGAPVVFRDDVYPILKARCFACHAGPDAESGYRLDVHDEILGHSSGHPLAVPGKSGESRLLELVTPEPDADDRMPPDGEPLSGAEVDVLRRWIDQGVKWDRKLLPPPQLETDHWAFQPVERPEIPAVDAPEWVRTPVDAFVARKHAEAEVTPAPPASQQTLIRRLSLDLLGLPPSPEEVRAFVDDPAPDAYERLVERLLASPRYGERWGRHWLDLARWAESNGHQHNRTRPHAWRYRDYVTGAFNDDKPYDRFLREQIAGDELTPYRDENVVATGFLAAARYSGNELDKAIQRNDILVDVANATASAVLGLTLECAQCHNHKFDPITARDYYRFQGLFLKGQPVNVVLDAGGEDRAQIVRERDAIFAAVRDRLLAAKRRQQPGQDVNVLPKHVLKGMSKEERARYDALTKELQSLPQTWAFYSPVSASAELEVPRLELRWPLPFGRDAVSVLEPRLLVRGDVGSPGPVVDPGWPAVFGPVPEDAPIDTKPRTALVDWLVSPENPLTARVWVNRIWQYHFGRGLVASASNFGVGGSPPSHPELLDWLASDLREHGWSTKHVHRRIVLSATYRQSSRYDAAFAERDPENRLLWRWTPRRLEAEAIRDSLLAASGELSPKIGGPSVKPESVAARSRRAIYLLQRRDDLPRMQDLFDGPSANSSCSRRRVSTVPLQPLFLLNGRFVRERAARLAGRVERMAQDADADRLRTAFRIVLGREPDSAELEQALAFLDSDEDSGAFERLCHVLINTNEFLYVP